ncbi:MAG: peptide-methionine (R)-S-oxide reductase [Micavibrio aeruginosavorus]|uniref:peptide-methionine (R)-S-oxide reductase n=1 Tax=Micavibrio aeruginosavorus TaxID=349221 RepID=A0A2W5N234_9BACT|nr:MAG: peptide-methionine (R)-S-oxide reductase [Micavibrio aeruginosavorus]
MKHGFNQGRNVMIDRRGFITALLSAAAIALLPGKAMADLINFNFLKQKGADFPYKLTDAQWREKLGEQGYAVLREGSNEDAGTSPLLRQRGKGVYACRGCGVELFASASKLMTNDFPTFRAPIDPKRLGLSTDFKIILPRPEVHCKNCGSHLGYKYTVNGEGAELWRYVMNGASLMFISS